MATAADVEEVGAADNVDVGLTVDKKMERMLGGGHDADVEILLETGFQKIPVSDFPLPGAGRVIEIPSDASIREAIQTLSTHGILSAPVRNTEASPSDTWMKRYVGIVDFAGIALWVLDKLDEMAKVEKDFVELGGEPDESFYRVVEDMEVFNSTKVSAVTSSFRWGPFLPVTMEDSLLSVLIILSRYNFHRVPVVDMGGDQIRNMITQSAVVKMLSEAKGRWFDSIGEKTIAELGLPASSHQNKITKSAKVDVTIPFEEIPINKKLGLNFSNEKGSNDVHHEIVRSRVVSAREDAPVLDAFRLMKKYELGGIPIVDANDRVVGNISARDIRVLISRPDKVLPVHQILIIKEFLNEGCDAFTDVITQRKDDVDNLGEVGGPRTMRPPVICTLDDTLRTVIGRMVKAKVHRVYVVDDDQRLLGVVTLQDIIGWVVSEPEAGWLSTHMKRLQGIV